MAEKNTMKPFLIGNVKVEIPVALAPMAGYTDSAFRSMCKKFHCGLVFTEVTNAAGIVHGSKPTLHLLETVPDERPIGAHIYGSDPGIMADAASIIESLNRFDLIDINCGCPVRKIVAKGAGAALMKDPKKIHDIVRAVRERVSLPVTIKTRTGFSEDSENISEIAHAAEEAGASAISIHARVASKKHGGSANWKALARVKSERSIPVIGNGGISSADDALRMLNETNVDAIMIGRAAVGHPWLFEEIHAKLFNHDFQPLTMEERKSVMIEHVNKLIALKELEQRVKRRKLPPEQSAVLHFRGHFFRYFSGFRGFDKIKRNLQTMNSLDQMLEAVDCLTTEVTTR